MSSPATTAATPAAERSIKELAAEYVKTEEKIKQGGGKSSIDRQHEKGRLTARERVALLIDKGTTLQEYGLWSAYGMYAEQGGAPAAGVVTGIGTVEGRRCMIVANDATVKAGAFFPMTCKKIIRAQTIAMFARLPLLYLVDSAGVFLPLQEDVFPDTDDFGRIFRNNAIISAEGIPQIAAIMGYCVAGGGYLPVLCDTLLMTEGSGLYLAGPALVKAAIGQEVTDEELGGASMHAAISGTIDFKEKNDPECITRLRDLVRKYNFTAPPRKAPASFHSGERLYEVFTEQPGAQYDVLEIIACLVDSKASRASDGSESLAPDFDEYKAEYGQSIVCGYATIGGHACGIVANQKKITMRTTAGGKAGPGKAVQMPGVIYDDSADKSARFIMDCNQRKIPILFLHDTTGFMVGRDSEQGGIIRAGAKMVNAMSNCIVPKIVVILGGSYGAGNYAMCGRAFDQFLSFAWPNAKCAVMGANQATGVLTTIEEASRKRKGETIDEAAHKAIYGAIHAGYTEQADIRHGAARGWVDRIIQPHQTREEIVAALDAANQNWDYSKPFKTGVLQT
ncbi:MAG: acyl-CoA carboxylase subunit beta [Planctomycetota bacterium]|nr:acyl-CoA carboxylase subunit beta [Planctomycetota bacterium]